MGKPYLHAHHRFKNGKDHCYWRIVEKVRGPQGQWIQRPILYLQGGDDTDVGVDRGAAGAGDQAEDNGAAAAVQTPEEDGKWEVMPNRTISGLTPRAARGGR